MQAEFSQLVDGGVLTFPLKQGVLTELLMKINMKSKRKQTISPGYVQKVEDLRRNSCWDITPCNILKIILADDDSTSNKVLRKMIEQSSKYKVVPCYNGLEVYLTII